jgi:hypothetical protein
LRGTIFLIADFVRKYAIFEAIQPFIVISALFWLHRKSVTHTNVGTAVPATAVHYHSKRKNFAFVFFRDGRELNKDHLIIQPALVLLSIVYVPKSEL